MISESNNVEHGAPSPAQRAEYDSYPAREEMTPISQSEASMGRWLTNQRPPYCHYHLPDSQTSLGVKTQLTDLRVQEGFLDFTILSSLISASLSSNTTASLEVRDSENIEALVTASYWWIVHWRVILLDKFLLDINSNLHFYRLLERYCFDNSTWRIFAAEMSVSKAVISQAGQSGSAEMI